ncbi:D-alanine-D-alanine ligase [Hamadaea flava]|uniref:D-alanine--D-alanine ligase n=1 Tax=Hamadaea flava TaxID=1742688 RepID=A0ABV8LNY3_9ACTN|nr:D-alanine--D-alanine ligase family protein [Hamadaea flava]MCP2321550.1 D-alanine-D-alanine ligase [Hamadaea flava]
MSSIDIGVLSGGRSGEHEVSRNSARSIIAHLDPVRYTVTDVVIGRDGGWSVDGVPATFGQALGVLAAQTVVLPALHGPYGEDGTVQAMLEHLGVTYVGNGVLASAAGMDKEFTKKLLAADGLRVAPGVVLRRGSVLEEFRLPVFVKPARAGSSLGVSRVTRAEDLVTAIDLAFASDDKVLVEPEISGREIDVAVLEFPDGRIEAGPPLEIRVTGDGFFDYSAKYAAGATFDIPARLDAATTALLQDQAIRAFRALDCRGLLRVDFFLPPTGEPVVNEVNTFPGFTAASQFPQIWATAGIPFPNLLDILIATALGASRDSLV